MNKFDVFSFAGGVDTTYIISSNLPSPLQDMEKASNFEDENIIPDFYSQNINTKFIKNITGDYKSLQNEKVFVNKKHNNNDGFIEQVKTNTKYSMFKSQCVLNNILYSCERLCIGTKIGLCFKKENVSMFNETNHVLIGEPEETGEFFYFNSFLIRAEDPRIFIFNEEVYVVFICLSPYENQYQCIAITKFEEWNPVFLQIENENTEMKCRNIEKNWSPFVKNNKIHFVYSYDPLIILEYDLNKDGICKIVFKQENAEESPFHNTENTYLRGGTNLLPYYDDYYIGACHTRTNIQKDYYTVIVILDTKNWEIVHLSKPVMYLLPFDSSKENIKEDLCFKKMGTNINILHDKSRGVIQSPCSFYLYNDKYYITVNIRDTMTFLFNITFKNLDFVPKINFSKRSVEKLDGFSVACEGKLKKVGYYQELTKNMIINNPLDI